VKSASEQAVARIRHQESEARRLAPVLLAPEHQLPERASVDVLMDEHGLSAEAAGYRNAEIEAIRRRRRGEKPPLPRSVIDFLREAKRRGVDVRINSTIDRPDAFAKVSRRQCRLLTRWRTDDVHERLATDFVPRVRGPRRGPGLQRSRSLPAGTEAARDHALVGVVAICGLGGACARLALLAQRVPSRRARSSGKEAAGHHALIDVGVSLLPTAADTPHEYRATAA
jgi:hypothetical protein